MYYNGEGIILKRGSLRFLANDLAFSYKNVFYVLFSSANFAIRYSKLRISNVGFK